MGITIKKWGPVLFPATHCVARQYSRQPSELPAAQERGRGELNSAHVISAERMLNVHSFSNRFNSIVCGLDCNVSKTLAPFSSSLLSVRLGALDVLKYDGHGLRGGRRGFQHIRQDALDDFIVAIPLTVPVAITQAGRSAHVEPGACGLLTTAKPFEGLCGTAPSYTYSEFVLRLPGPLLRQHMPNIDDCCARSISVRGGTGKVLLSLVETLIDERNDYSALQAARFGTMVLDAVVNLTLGAPELANFQSRQNLSAHARIFAAAREFIESNLSNSSLDPRTIAQHCDISTSYLHAAFAAHSTSVSGFVRETRLQRCRSALQNPALRHQSIIEIAMRWGFNSASSFNHAYRARFGKSPSEDRVLSLSAPLLSKNLHS